VTDARGVVRPTHIVVINDENQVWDVDGDGYATLTDAVEAVLEA